jgi:hypothetical protein
MEEYVRAQSWGEGTSRRWSGRTIRETYPCMCPSPHDPGRAPKIHGNPAGRGGASRRLTRTKGARDRFSAGGNREGGVKRRRAAVWWEVERGNVLVPLVAVGPLFAGPARLASCLGWHGLTRSASWAYVAH